jgi:hypothetical protein
MWLTSSLLEAAARVHPLFPAVCLGGVLLGPLMYAGYVAFRKLVSS